jgi:anti-sigma factor ChrR (cupin superfamily)
MSSPLHDLLIDYAMGALSDPERARFEAELAKSPPLAEELAIVERSLAALAFTLPPQAPSSDGKSRLLAAVETSDRLSRFIAPVAEIFGLAKEKVGQIFGAIADHAKWEPAMPGVRLFHFEGSTTFPAMDTGLVVFEAGIHFPKHRHLADEHIYVLQGSYHDLESGETFRPGQRAFRAKGTVHAFDVAKDEDLIVVTAQNGFELV